MKYMLLVYSPESSWTTEQWKQCVETSMGICQELVQKGQLIAASPLHPVATAKTIRVRDGQPVLTTGPFAETAEQLGGFYILDVPDLDVAIQIAARLPAAKKGTVEIRPVFKLDGLPKELFNNQAAISDPEQQSWKQFMFLCYDDEQYWQQAGADALRSAMAEAVQLTHQLNEQGMFVSAAPLHPSTTATSVRIRDGQRTITDGPFAETREVLGGFYVIRAASIEQALQYAQHHSGARVGAVEVRQVFDVRNV
ncbi:MAG: YciI family protein [Pirellulales bacterium]